MKIDLVVTRHPGLIEVLAEQGICDKATPVVAHATPDQIRGKNIAGVLPLALAAVCESVTEVSLSLPAELRGQELTAAQVRSHMTGTRTYRVLTVPSAQEVSDENCKM